MYYEKNTRSNKKSLTNRIPWYYTPHTMRMTARKSKVFTTRFTPVEFEELQRHCAGKGIEPSVFVSQKAIESVRRVARRRNRNGDSS